MLNVDMTNAIPEAQAQEAQAQPARIVLNNADRDRFLEALASEEEPNELLVQAAQRFSQKYGK